MGNKRTRVRVNLNRNPNIEDLLECDIEKILRAADDIIGIAGRSMLAKILKGSKDKKVLKNNLQNCPSYGYYSDKTIAEITDIADWMILNNFLDISYAGQLPMIVFTNYGWELYKPIYANELISKMIMAKKSPDYNNLIILMKDVNRQVVLLLLEIIVIKKHFDAIKFLKLWEIQAYKKVAKKIRYTLKQLEKY
ncbi:MAG: RQC-minor-1 family DNA-binding protein [Alkaliphilus sp.]